VEPVEETAADQSKEKIDKESAKMVDKRLDFLARMYASKKEKPGKEED